MGEHLSVSGDLEEKFKKFGPLADILTDISNRCVEINAFNRNSAGHDDIGKTYHENVDRPTVDLVKLFTLVSSEVERLGVTGRLGSRILHNAGEDATHQV
ncbi:hypothetical protein [Kitasatospora sp. NPDC085879]|uniref:hypothetical protein n=1 Tax=Kitasatospora sp. NPDC085879 TaxID=3154769 RepID=UPI00342BCA2C